MPGLGLPPMQPLSSGMLADTMPQALPDRAAYEDLQRRRKNIPTDVILNYNMLDKLIHGVKTFFVTTPKTILRGLSGAPDYTFSEAMQVAKVPYYLGGVFLTLSPLIGGNKPEAIRLGASVLMYLAGMSGTKALINAAYKMRYGVDLGLLYRSKSGQVENVYASSNFPRFDLLTPHHYNDMANKLGIPEGVYERDGAVRENLRYIINSSRTLKLVVANIISAIGAGYIARSDAWLNVPSAFTKLPGIWKDSRMGIGHKVQASLANISEPLIGVVRDRFNLAGGSWWQKAVILGGLGTMAASLAYIVFNGIPNKHYTVLKKDNTVDEVTPSRLPQLNMPAMPEFPYIPANWTQPFQGYWPTWGQPQQPGGWL